MVTPHGEVGSLTVNVLDTDNVVTVPVNVLDTDDPVIVSNVIDIDDVFTDKYSACAMPRPIPPVPAVGLIDIPIPTVDQKVLEQYSKMIKDVWPEINPKARPEFPVFASTYTAIKNYALPNFLGAQITVDSDLNLGAWQENLKGFHDAEIYYYLKYGWPVGYNRMNPPEVVEKNHPSATQHRQHVKEFIATEISYRAMVGPFKDPPFLPWTRISPMMTRPKKESDLRRIIVDLSYPEGSSVNAGIDISNILGRDTSYSLPNIMDLVTRVQVQGSGSFIWKADLARAYRQLRIDPIDMPLLGVKFDSEVYVDCCPPFGCRSSSTACQRVANALMYFMNRKGKHTLAYLDDFAGCERHFQDANNAFEQFKALADELGLELSSKKCVAPQTKIEWLGYIIDTVNLTLAIPHKKMGEVLSECDRWYVKKKASKTMVQSLVGKLLYVATCIKQARKFVSRILNTLRGMQADTWITVSEDFFKDVKWFLLFAERHNGIVLYDVVLQSRYIECDSCLTGGGGNTQMACYMWCYDQSHTDRFPAIHHFEAVNVLVAYRTLAPLFHIRNATIVIFTDNSASAYALTSGKTADPILAQCARELWLEAATNNHDIQITYKPGSDIPIADALSRYYVDDSKRVWVDQIIVVDNLTVVPPVFDPHL